MKRRNAQAVYATAVQSKIICEAGVEMERSLGFARGLPVGTDLKSAIEGYGNYMRGVDQDLRRSWGNRSRPPWS